MNRAQQVERASPIGYFRINGQFYEHRIFTSTDDRVECVDALNNTVLIYTANCEAKKPDGSVMGRFNMNKDRTWAYTHEATQRDYHYGTNLLSAEMEVSRMYLTNQL
jgi:hypothetical protein